MKKTLLVVVCIFSLFSVKAQVLFSYNFSTDTVGRPLEGVNGWSAKTDRGFPGGGGCAGFACQTTIVTDTMRYPGFPSSFKAINLLKADALGHYFKQSSTLPDTAFKPVYRNGDKVYVAFLIKPNTNTVDSSGVSNGQIVRVHGADRFNSELTVGMRLIIQKKNGKARFGVDKNGGTQFTGFTYDLGKEHLIVLRYTYRDTINANDEAALFVNPVASVTEPAALLSTTSGDDIAPKRIVAYLNNFALPNIVSVGTLGSMRVTSRWSDIFSTISTRDIRTEALKVRPTLAENNLEIQLESVLSKNAQVTISDVTGRAVQSFVFATGEQYKTLNVSSLAKGFYVVTVQNNEFIATEKFVKQ
jgi:hypothetical protein